MRDEGILNKTTSSSISSSSSTNNDEILTSLLKINNFDNSIKDESLDINLSACVTISTDPTIICNNSVSSDFWKVFDESAQADETGSLSNRSTAVEEISFVSLLPPPPLGSEQHQKSLTGWESDVLPSSILPSPTKKKHNKSRKQTTTKQQQSHKIDEDNAQRRALPITHDESPLPISNNSFKGNFPIAPESKLENSSLAPTTEYKFKCEHCRIVLNGLEEFTKHEASHKILIKCNECDREFANESGLKKHVKSHREDSRKDGWKKCPDCGKCLKLGSMWMHRKIHSDNKKYGCDICGQKFVQKINLTHHQRVHTAEKPYECAECPKRFQERSHLQRHQKYHAQTRPFRCEKCGKMYKTERCLKVHNLVHLEQRPFACQVCNKSFISNSKLKQHSNIHTGERPFKCNYCTRDFTNFPNWLKHTRRRHKVDHKTGELLEHMPSYCSKSSGKKSTAAAAGANAEGKPTRKKKKADTADQNKIVTTTSQLQSQQQQQPPPPLPLPKSSQSSPTVQLMKAKVKLEADPEPAEVHTNTNFSDLHSLSITSAEELIMEQALEMEEFCFYKSQLDQFCMQKEFSVKKEFENKALCSVDSSPFSSPASVELPITYNIQSLPSTTISTAGRNTSSESATSNAMRIQVFKNQTLPSVDTLINACFFKSENQNM
ncbi:serendipity locus protein H-1 [Episyrphus balteatus]|uniref:serendipity locus protein H-1 n=1 Tax=Episyrphus balteatus TaxID=286459 RepID=UPI00248609A6|nr:serendipity locus protein H-1 [Episyrphus balteatus]